VVLLAVLGCLGAVRAAVAAVWLAAAWPAVRAVPGALLPVAVAGIAAGGVAGTVLGAVLLAAAVIGLLSLLSLVSPEAAVVLAVVLAIAVLPFVGPVAFRPGTRQAPGEQRGGLVPPPPRRPLEPRLVRGRR